MEQKHKPRLPNLALLAFESKTNNRTIVNGFKRLKNEKKIENYSCSIINSSLVRHKYKKKKIVILKLLFSHIILLFNYKILKIAIIFFIFYRHPPLRLLQLGSPPFLMNWTDCWPGTFVLNTRNQQAYTVIKHVSDR